MGAGQSTSQTPSKALHVLRVTPSSPASRTTIEPSFDFIVGFDGETFKSDHTLDASPLERIVEEHEGRTLNLWVWNSKTQETRGVFAVITRSQILAASFFLVQWYQSNLLVNGLNLTSKKFGMKILVQHPNHHF